MQVKNKIFLIALFLLTFLKSWTQETGNIKLFTDRDLYISGETLLLKAFLSPQEQSGNLSVDLVNQSGSKILGIINRIEDLQCDGFIYLPDSLSSGSYLLRASTSLDNILTFKEIYVVNRFGGLPSSNTILRPVIPVTEDKSTTDKIQLNGIDLKYGKRANGKGEIILSKELADQFDGHVSIQIARVSSEYKAATFHLKSDGKQISVPDKNGIILNGTVLDFQTMKPFKNALVYLSIPDSLPGFQYYVTGDDGQFYFQLEHYYGKIPVVIQCKALGVPQLLKIRMNSGNNFGKVMPVFEKQAFPEKISKEVERDLDAVTFRKAYNQKDVDVQPAPKFKRDSYCFYGTPTKIVDPKLFIDLPNFSEIARELLPGVKFRTYNRMPAMQVLNMAQFAFLDQAPLVLLDGIPITDLTLIKEMGTKDIEKVEICNFERFFGDICFPGVVAIYTTKGDYSRIPESNDLIKLNLDVYQPRAVLSKSIATDGSIPDLRQVLLWDPSVKVEQKIAVEFQTSDIQGNFRLVIRGMLKDGTLFFKAQNFEVN